MPVFNVTVQELKICVLLFPEIFKQKLHKEMLPVFFAPPFANFQISHLGVVPKKEHNSYHFVHHSYFPFKLH